MTTSRNPSNHTYNIFFTIIIAIFILWLTYLLTPYQNYTIYFNKN